MLLATLFAEGSLGKGRQTLIFWQADMTEIPGEQLGRGNVHTVSVSLLNPQLPDI